MTASSVVEHVRKFSFARQPWKKSGDMIECPPGTWDKPYASSPPDWAALVCCPNCKVPAAISALIHKIDWRGKLNKEWTCPKCQLTLDALLNAWGNETLFAVAFEDNGVPKVIVKHGENVHKVRREFKMRRP